WQSCQSFRIPVPQPARFDWQLFLFCVAPNRRMQMSERLVIVGNGMAPGRMLEHLFEAAPGRFEVTIFNAEPRVNYNRLMLSPVLSGEKSYAEIITHGDEWYAEHGVTLHKSAPVTQI